MIKQIVLVVGDRFAQFAAGKDVMTLSQIRELLDGGNTVVPSHRRIIVLPGQGLGDADVDALLQLEQSSPYRSRFDFSQWRYLPRRAASTRSHKRCPQNTLISEPRRLNEDEFEMSVLIDEKCDLMSDHQSGQHLQGMVLVEAARQSLLAVVESFFIPRDGNQYSFVFNDMSVKYNHFAFPLPAVLRHVICEKDLSKPKRLSFVSEISIEQSGLATASFRMAFAAIEAGRIGQRESRMAQKAVEDYFDDVVTRLHRKHVGDIAVNA